LASSLSFETCTAVILLATSNRTTERDQIKDEADHRAMPHLYKANDEQLAVLRRLAERLVAQTPPASSS
jgi:UDP:flavonoid glycosyltransferase YjiC (YdhE family)